MQPATGNPMMTKSHQLGRPVLTTWKAKQNWMKTTIAPRTRMDCSPNMRGNQGFDALQEYRRPASNVNFSVLCPPDTGPRAGRGISTFNRKDNERIPNRNDDPFRPPAARRHPLPLRRQQQRPAHAYPGSRLRNGKSIDIAAARISGTRLQLEEGHAAARSSGLPRRRPGSAGLR